MAEPVLETWDWQRNYQEIRQQLTRRWQYRHKGRPCPTELTNAGELIQTLERMKPILKQQINSELAAQALWAMQSVTATYVTHLTSPTLQTSRAPTETDMPKTPSELQLEQVRIMQGWAQDDAESQHSQRRELERSTHCGLLCAYPDQCTREGEHKRVLPSTYQGHCHLYQLQFHPQSFGRRVKTLLGQPEPAVDVPGILRRIRQSFFYSAAHESCLGCIRNQKCSYTQGRQCLVRLVLAQWEGGDG